MGSARDEVMHRAGGATHEAATFVSQLAEKSVDAAKEMLNDTTASGSKGSPASAG